MGNDEAIIYGDRHGELYREYVPGTTLKVKDNGAIDESDAPVTKQFFPNAVKLNVIGGTLSIGIVTFDQETGEQNRFYGDNDNDQFDSLWTDLDRQGVNRLIRDLRRMRDRVFGKDE